MAIGRVFLILPRVEHGAGFVAAYNQVRLLPTHQLVGVAGCRSLFVATPLSGFRLPARSPACQSTCTAGRRFGEGRGALHLALFEQPQKDNSRSSLFEFRMKS